MLTEDQIGNIEELGLGQATCRLRCAGIDCDAKAGRPPRGLVLDLRDQPQGRGIIIVGLNPGRAKDPERRELASSSSPYLAWRKYWITDLRDKHPYFKKTQQLLQEAGENGPILWTDIAKCETPKGGKGPPVETLRTCMERYLQHEIWSMPKEWPLLALGRQVYHALAVAYLDRVVVGIPHPSGTGPDFHYLFGKNKRVLPEVISELSRALRSDTPTASWVSAKKPNVGAV